MEKKFLKPFAATIGALLATAGASADATPLQKSLGVDLSHAANVAGSGIVLENSASDMQQDTGHASHASHSSHASHASSAY